MEARLEYDIIIVLADHYGSCEPISFRNKQKQLEYSCDSWVLAQSVAHSACKQRVIASSARSCAGMICDHMRFVTDLETIYMACILS